MPKLGGLKFELSEKPIKFEKNLSHGFDKSADLLGKHHNKDFFKLCVLLRKSELYLLALTYDFKLSWVKIIPVLHLNN